MANLPLGVNLQFAGHAYNSDTEPLEIFTGQVFAVLTGIEDQVVIPMAVVDDGVSAVLPRITNLIHPNGVAPSSTSGAIHIEVSGVSNETLTFAITPGIGGGTFTNGSGPIGLEGTNGSVDATYNAPAEEAVYIHTLLVTNSQGNYVERQFPIEVCASCGNPVTVNTAPVIASLGGQRFDVSGTTIEWTAEVTDDGPANQLLYQWYFDGGLLFADAQVNPATLLDYTILNYGLLRVTVTDMGGEAGALSTTLAFFMPTNQFPSPGSSVTAGIDGNWQQIATGVCHTLGIRQDGTLWSWGCNDSGQLGLGFQSGTHVLVPTQVGTSDLWVEVRAGDSFSMARQDNDGTLSVWTWGANGNGQLGLGDTTNRDVPSQVMHADMNSGGGIAGIAAAEIHALALRADGSLWAWGHNGSGQLGTGDTAEWHSPVRVGVATDWTAVSAAGQLSMGIRGGTIAAPHGTLRSWGANGEGQLGIGNTAVQYTPQQVGTATNWEQLSIGNDSSYAINSLGQLWAWGRNGEGQLGTGDTIQRQQPVRIGLTSDVWLTVVAGDDHTLAIKDINEGTGSLWAWGTNGWGQLGAGDVGGRATPTQVGVEDDWRDVGANSITSFALKDGNSLWGFGYNGQGQLGLGVESGSANWKVPTEVRQ